MSAQSEGNYAEALQNYYEATRPEIDPYDRSYILYNIGLIHTSNGEHTKALESDFRALERNPFLPQAFNNMAVICHYSRSTKVLSSGVASDPKDRREFHNLFRPGEQAIIQGDSEIAEAWFDQAAEYWKQAIALTPGNPGNYIEAHNW
ncbi:hypothetical protein M5K25_028265 [Dendrobium thyrsiflorum]|uniref:Photosystem I assembly protein Ycf3 n=1 Tax=Dendrobium thyrsiflorum TaxID=117978 RepID=A0ABD0TTQ2_DENTH